ncbi:GNAT family N-acetyltransferase [Actinophytocola glycyrrhizae]|uniref:GNAT family N-acetyltransferase n=1 Tax=Actinophytocola glycyrrhizae TaxID=2044873 RepID=A0ABV9RRY7_9PSEU
MKVETAPAIATERLVLSRLARHDVDDLVAMLVKPALYRYIGDAPASAVEAGHRVERWLGGSVDPDLLWINYVARVRDDGRFVGLAQATVRRARASCEVAYLVDPSVQRHGFGAEMMTGFCAELRETLNPVEFIAHIHPGHVASEGVAKAIGLTPTADRVDGELVWRSAVGP